MATTAKDLIRDFAQEVRDMSTESLATDGEIEERLEELMKDIAEKICN